MNNDNLPHLALAIGWLGVSVIGGLSLVAGIMIVVYLIM